MPNLAQAAQYAKPSKVATAERTRQALELRKGGASYSDIGKALGVSKQRAHKIVIDAVDEINAHLKEEASGLKRIELERLDAMWMALWPRRKEPRVVDSLLRISERRARFEGLDAPAEIKGDLIHHHQVDATDLIERIIGRRPKSPE